MTKIMNVTFFTESQLHCSFATGWEPSFTADRLVVNTIEHLHVPLKALCIVPNAAEALSQ